MSADRSGSIGEEIRAARKGADLTIAEVANRAKLRSAVLQAIENDDFSLCGGDTYARGHLKVIAGILKIDSTFLLEKFDEKFGKFETALLDLSEKGKRNLEKPSKSTKASWKTLSTIAVVVIALVTVVQISGSAPKNEVVSATPPSVEQPIPATASVEPEAKVVITGIKSYSWISVSDAAGNSIFTGEVRKGETKVFTDRQLLRFVIGNAGAVTLTVNGEDRGIPGKIGEVVRLQFAANDAPVAG
ncbi:MAG: helix-turn-helix domain-containing protein [Actinomycetes bacterium]